MVRESTPLEPKPVPWVPSGLWIEPSPVPLTLSSSGSVPWSSRYYGEQPDEANLQSNLQSNLQFNLQSHLQANLQAVSFIPLALHPLQVNDLANIRAVAFYLSKTELKFDLVSAVDELSKQVWNGGCGVGWSY